MSKDFDKWNSEKKRIHDGEQNKLYHEREIWWIALGVNIGFEQDGTGSGYQRPAIILKGYSKHVCLIVPLTTSLKQNPYHIGVGPVDGKEAFAIISQIRLIDTCRLINKVETLDMKHFKAVRKAIKAML